MCVCTYVYLKASPLPPAPLHATTYKSTKALPVSYNYSTYQMTYQVSCCFVIWEAYALMEEVSTNGCSMITRVILMDSIILIAWMCFSEYVALV